MSRTNRDRRRLLGALLAGCLVLVAVLIAVRMTSGNQAPRDTAAGGVPRPADASAGPAGTLPADTKLICGQPVLRSPYTYDGKAGAYSSGTAALPTYGKPGTDFPRATAGVVLPPETKSYQNWQLKPNTVYYLRPGVHIGNFAANANDAFVGGYAGGKGTTLSGNYSDLPWAVDSNSSQGDQPGVTIEYLTIEKYQPPVDQVAINQDGNSGWSLLNNTITLNVPGGGAFVATDGIAKNNCMTLNGQYGFQSAAALRNDSVTAGPYNITIADNEISYNDTCDLSGLMNNAAIGWHNYNPVPEKYRNPKCGKVTGDGNQGGFKLWATNGVTIKDNYIHHNWGPGGWADTNNANTTWTGNTIVGNEGAAIMEEISYNFSITDNYLAGNDWVDGLNNPKFPQPAIYISESGSDSAFGGVPACPEASCASQGSYRARSVISGNTLVDNGGSIFLWQNSNRYCGDSSDGVCTLVKGTSSRSFKISACRANLPSTSINTTTYVGNRTGSPREDWWDGCMWRSENVSITKNMIYFNPTHIMYCTLDAWSACGAGGIFSEYGGAAGPGGWVVPTQLTFFQHNSWADNTYRGPSTFYAWNQGNGNNPVSWADWTGDQARGTKCSSANERKSGYCIGPFGQDAGSTYTNSPAAAP
jgi:parallel beta helix pectate lyase-like protein